MKFPENELIYMVQSNTKWRFLKLWVQRNSACSQALTNKQSQQNSNVQQVKNHVSGLVPQLPPEYHPKFNISMLNNGVP
jgi:hypothetical protein